MHTIIANVSDKCYFASIDNISLSDIKCDFHFSRNYTKPKEFLSNLCETLDSFLNTSLIDEKKLLAKNRPVYKTTDEVLERILEIVTATDPETADQGETSEKKMDDVLFETLIRNAKNFPPCDFPGATKLLNICQQMNKTQLSDFCKILIEKGIFKYEYGQIVTAKGRLLICPRS